MKLASKPIFVVVVVLALVVGAVLVGGSWSATAIEDLKVFPSERDAAYSASSSTKAEPAISSLKQGEPVTIIWDTYGKDYWACYVRTSTNQYGWVLCTSLKQRTT